MSSLNRNTLKKIGIFAAVLIAVFAGVFLTIRLAFFLLPFLIAFALSSLMEPIIKMMSDKLHIKRKYAAPIVLIVLLGIIIMLLVLAVLKLISEIKDFIITAPETLSNLYMQIIEWSRKGTAVLDWLPPEVASSLGNVISDLSNTITSLGRSILKGAFATATSLPEALIFLIITILATYFMSSDRYKIAGIFHKHLPESWINRMKYIRNEMFSALFGYLRAALIIMSVTFTELFIGFSIINVKYPLLLAFLIAMIDALPILGTGGILIPWSLYSFVTGDVHTGISILILYLIVLIVRQMIEPKVVGDQIGVYPLITLLSMYTGLQLIGFAGLIIGPVTYLLIRNILFTIYKNRTIKDIIGFEPVNQPDSPSSKNLDT